MPKKTRYPKLRVHVKKGRGGQVWTSYWFDNRSTGEPDTALGTDYDEALKRWDELYNQKKRIAGTLEEAFKRWEAEVLPAYESAETRKGYTKHLRMVRPVFGPAAWSDVTLPVLKGYLRKRTAKTQANREMALLSIVWNWARGEGLTSLVWPAHGMERSRWKNQECARNREITDEAFDAIYVHADDLLRDALDLATATGMRVRDVLALRLSDVRSGKLLFQASKTGKKAEFDLSASSILPAIVERRKLNKTAEHVFMLVNGKKPVTERMLHDRFVKARTLAAEQCPECGDLTLRDMRKRAAQLAGDLQEASNLLQHSSPAVTRKHYAQGQKVRPVR